MGCNHEGSTFYHRVGEGLERRCDSCKVFGSGRTAEEAHVSFLKARMQAGEKLKSADEMKVAFFPAPWGTAPSRCASTVVRVRPNL